MIEKTEAVGVVLAHLDCLSKEGDVQLVLKLDKTIEKGFGWVFFYNSKQFIESGDFSDRLIGTSPIIVDRQDGSLHETGTAFPIEVYMSRYEKYGSVYPPDHGE